MFAGAVFAIVLIGLAWRYTSLSELLTRENVTHWAKAVRGTRWAPIVVVLAYTPGLFLMVPRPVLTLFAVVAFGPWVGFACGVSGVVLAGVAAYYVGRAISPRTIERLMRGKMKRVKQVLQRHGVISVMTLRVVPTAPYIIESMACGALCVNVVDYVIGTALGMAPGALATTFFSQQLAAALEDLSQVSYWAIGATIVVFVVVMYLLRRWLSH